MNKIFSLIICAVLTMPGFAQIDRSKQPKPGPAPEIKIQEPEMFTLPNGITVLVVENHKLPKVSVTYSIDRGPVREGKKVGVSELMGQMLNEGTKTMSKDQFDKEVDLIGANVNIFSSGGSASALTRYFGKAFELMTDAIKNPVFNEESFEKLKKQFITSIKSNEKSASAIAGDVSTALAFGKETSLGEFTTVESIEGLTLQDVKDFYAKYITPSRGYLVFVGDITVGQAKNLAIKYLGDWKGPKLSLPEFSDASNPGTTEINFVDLPTASQCEIYVSNLIKNPMNNPDYHKLLLTNQILGGGSDSKLFLNLREKHGFTYGSYSSIGSGRFQTQFKASAQVRSEKADSAIAEIMREIENMRNGNITEEELAIAKAKYNGSFALGMEDPSKTASYAMNILINNLPKDFYKTFLQKINEVSITDIQFVSNKYLSKDNSRIVVVGNGDKILPNLSSLGYPIKMYDKYANPVVETKEDKTDDTPKTSEAVSASSIVNKYLTAIGGKEEVQKLQSIKSIFMLEMTGANLDGVMYQLAPNKYKMELSMQGRTLMKEVFNGTTGYRSQMGQNMDYSADDIKNKLDSRGVIPQLFYISNDYQAVYTGTGKVGKEGVYILKITKPSGSVGLEYYSIQTGLLLKEETTLTSPDGQDVSIVTTYTNYKKVGNYTMPFTITQDVEGQELVMNISEYIFNKDVSDSDFE